MSIDPVTTDANTGGSFNRYVYANNNPYKYVDPDGRFPLIGMVVGAGFEAVAQYSVSGRVSDWKAIIVAGAVGAVTGGLGGAAANAAIKGSISRSETSVAPAARRGRSD